MLPTAREIYLVTFTAHYIRLACQWTSLSEINKLIDSLIDAPQVSGSLQAASSFPTPSARSTAEGSVIVLTIM